MTNKLIPYLNANSSKEEERAFLATVRAQAGDGSYVRGLFSQELIDWLEDQISNDFPCDIMESLRAARKDGYEQAKKAVDEISRLKGELKSTQNLMGILEDEKQKLIKVMANFEVTINNLDKHNDEYLAELQKLNDEGRKLREFISKQDLEIIRLKALLWDKEHPEIGD
jgi:chromosome segregation ATPase